MVFKNRILRKTAACVMAVLLLASLAACKGGDTSEQQGIELEENVTLNLWYSDSRFTSYFEECASKYHEANANVSIELKRIDDENYFNDVYDSCMKSDNGADIFMLSSDDVQKAYLMGLMDVNTAYPDVYNENVYGRAAIEASSYSEKLLGYPLTFETTVMVYNKKFAREMKTFEEITDFSDNFQHTEENEQVTQIIGWDVSDIDVNYAFMGAYMSVGGDKADDVTKTYLADDKIKEAAGCFLSFKDSYGIIRGTPEYETYLSKFMEGSLLYTIVKTNDLAKIDESGLDYGIMAVPDYNASLKTKAMSRTYMLAVTPYASDGDEAKRAAKAFSYDYAADMNGTALMPAARGDIEDASGHYKALHSIYSDTSLRARYMESGDYYMRMEIMLHQIWDMTSSIDDAYAGFKDYVTSTMHPAASSGASS